MYMTCALCGALTLGHIRSNTAALWVFAVHFLLNLSWSYVFFGAQQIAGALFLLVAIVLTLLVVIALFWRVRKLAAVLLLPYLAWVCFATALNYQFLQLNPDADGSDPDGAVERVRI